MAQRSRRLEARVRAGSFTPLPSHTRCWWRLTIHRHEPWADEAQSWLLARDASLTDLWGRLLHYEGTPGLWQTLLHALIRLGLSYSAYSYVSAVLGLVAVWLLLRYAPLPLFIRILLPFTYFLCYQYAAVARSYALVAPLLFAIAILYPQAQRRPVAMTILLCLLAGVSAHGWLISVCIWLVCFAPHIRSRRLAGASLVYWLIIILFMLSAWPAQDVAFAENRGFSNLGLLPTVIKAALGAAFTGYWFVSAVVVLLSLPLLWRGGGWLFFLFASVAFCLFGTIVYTQVWHSGVLFLAWLFAIWISAQKTPITRPALVALLMAIGFQCYWTASAIRYDWAMHIREVSRLLSICARPACRRAESMRWVTQPPRSSPISPQTYIRIFTTERTKLIGIGPNRTQPISRPRCSLRRGATWWWWVTRMCAWQRCWADLLESARLWARPAFRRRHFLADRRL